ALDLGPAPAITIVAAPGSAGAAQNTAAVGGATTDPQQGNNSASASTSVVPAPPAPAITAPAWVPVGTTGQAASVAEHPGSTYAWTLTGGTITAGQSSSRISFDAGLPGTTMRLEVTESVVGGGCPSPTSTALVQVDFLDVPPAHPFHDFVDTIARNGVTAGCGNGNYCPDSPNTRAQMAVLLLKSKLGADHVPPPATGSVFLDVPASNPFAPWIEELAGLGVTAGCGGGNYCPLAPVTRAQMAVFLLKTLEGSAYASPPATGTVFGDVPIGGFAAAWIEELYNRGVTGGCQASPLLYCPSNPVTRGQMAVLLVKTFGLL
ncbi:MAG: S-layer homology domain-containing protein, partial [Thermoanaerobaculia bacterium]